MLSAIAESNKVAVLAPGGRSVAFVDVKTLATSTTTTAASSSFDRVISFQNRFIAYNSATGEVGQFASTGELMGGSKPAAVLENLVSLLPYGDGRLVAYLDLEERGELVAVDPVSFQPVEVIKSLKKRREDGKFKQYSASSQQCVVFTKGLTSVLGYRHLAGADEFFTLMVKGHKTCVEVLHQPIEGKTTVCCGLESGQIFVSRFASDYSLTVTSEFHWHSSAVHSLTLVNDLHLLSGGKEGTLVMWKLDQGTQNRDFRPRLGAPIASSCLAQDGQIACVVLEDGTLIQVSLPQMNLVARKIHCWTPQSTTLLVQKMDSRSLALFDDAYHAPGVIKVTSRFPQEEEKEHVIDVTLRNAVSTSAQAFRWKLEAAKFSPNGRVLACLLGCQDKHEARVFLNEQECLRVTLAPPTGSQHKACGSALLSVTNRACALVDPNAANKLVVMHLQGSVWATQTVFDLAPQRICSVSLSDDESCVACLCESGLVRVFDRKTGRVLIAASLPSVEAGSGVSFAKHSREVFAWNSSRVEALISQRVLTGLEIKFASAQAFGDSIALLMRSADVADAAGEEKRWALHLWDGRRPNSKPQRVEGVEPSEFWERFEFAGKELGWLLKSQDLGWKVVANAAQDGSAAAAAELGLGGARRIPGIALKTAGAGGKAAEKRGQLSTNAVPSVAEWCHELPSHLLHNPPPLQLVWPTWGFQPAATATAAPEPARSTKRAKLDASLPASAASASVQIAEQSEQERDAFQALFKVLK